MAGESELVGASAWVLSGEQVLPSARAGARQPGPGGTHFRARGTCRV